MAAASSLPALAGPRPMTPSRVTFSTSASSGPVGGAGNMTPPFHPASSHHSATAASPAPTVATVGGASSGVSASSVATSASVPSVPARPTILFVTRNTKKVEELNAILGDKSPYTISSRHIDLVEVQGDPEESAAQKAKLAARMLRHPVIVDDTSLCFNALKGLPGVYVEAFLEKIGVNGLVRMVDPYKDKTAYAQVIYALCMDPDEEPKIFIGRTYGRIVEPEGTGGFGWDPIFMPDGLRQTFAQISPDLKNRVSPRYKALKLVTEYLNELAAVDSGHSS